MPTPGRARRAAGASRPPSSRWARRDSSSSVARTTRRRPTRPPPAPGPPTITHTVTTTTAIIGTVTGTAAAKRQVRATFAVRHGDTLHMHSHCQQEWQHSVVREQPGGGVAAPSPEQLGTAPAERISLVFKRPWAAEPRPNEPPVAYVDALRTLRAAAAAAQGGGGPPPTSAARARVMRGCGVASGSGYSFTLARPEAARRPRANARFPALAAALFALEVRPLPRPRRVLACRPLAAAPPPPYPAPSRAPQAAVAPAGHPPSELCSVSVDAELTPHALPPTRAGTPAMIVALGGEGGEGGEVALGGGAPRGVRYSPLLLPAEGEATQDPNSGGGGGGLAMWTLPVLRGGEQHGPAEEDAAAAVPPPPPPPPLFHLTYFSPAPAADAAALAAALAPPLRYRPRSTDELVLGELLGPSARAYAGPPRGDPRWDWAAHGREPFALEGHAVLDVGAQIGAFTRVALAAGAARVLAVEPEPANAALWRENCGAGAAAERATLLQAAVAHGAPADGSGAATLVLGRARSDGVQNTWRHALRGLSHYKETEEQEQEGEQEEPGARAPTSVEVRTVPLFGAGGLLEGGEWSFVKLDCEGAELELLRRFAPGDWRGVRRLVFEWSFTKERRMGVFMDVVAALEAEGFDVWFEGKGNWEVSFEEWPWSADAVVYAARA